jgi:hypothetical protein
MMNHKKIVTLFILIYLLAWADLYSEAVPIESIVPKKDLQGGWELIDGPRIYNKKTLFEHIDGQAELFFKYGFQKSVFAIYQSKKNSENQIELDIYDMGNVLQAFGVFSRFRYEDRPIGIGLDSYLDDHSAFFYKGKYFVMLYATTLNSDILQEWAMMVSSKITDPFPRPKEISYFPKEGLKPGSIQYFSEGLLGHKFLKQGFIGTYIEEDKEFHLFLSIFKNSNEAKRAFKTYKDHLSRIGSIHSEITVQSKHSMIKGEDPYQGEVIVVQKGFYLLGVVGFSKGKDGENDLAELIKNAK